MEENRKVFREKAITRVTSPEQLNEYIRVATPGIWFILIAILLALVGMFVWFFYGTVDATLTTAGKVENGVLTCYVPEQNREDVNTGDRIQINDTELQVEEIGNEAVSIGEDFPEYALYLGNLEVGQWVFLATAGTDLADGYYKAVITTETVRPSSFIFTSRED